MNRISNRFLSAAVGLLALTSQSPAALIGYWNFDADTPPMTGTTGTVLDLSGKGYNGTLNTVTVTPDTRYSTDVPVELAGIAGAKSLTLLGGNHYVQVGAVGSGASNTDFNFAGGPFTVSFWFKAWPQTADLPIIAKNGTTASAQGWQIKRTSTAAVNLMHTTQGLTNVDFEPPDTVGVNASLPSGSPTPVPVGPGRWTHVTLTYDNTVKSVFINGMQTRSVSPTANGKITASAEPLVFGARSVAGVIGSHSSVQLDDVAIFNHALTAAEVLSLAKGADPRAVPATGRAPIVNRSYPWGVGEPWGAPGIFGVRALRDAEGPNTLGGTTLNGLGDVSYILRNKSAITRFANDPWIDNSSLYGKVSFRDPDNSGGTGIYAGPTAAIPVPAIPPNTTSYYYTSPWNIAGNEDHAFLTATGCIRIPAGVAGADNKWTFFHGGDDGTQLTIYNQTWFSRSNVNSLISGDVSVHGATGGNSNVFSTIVLPPGDYNVRLDYYEKTGGSWVELWAAPGTLTAITQIAPPRGADPWRLVGDTAQGGLALVDHMPLVELSCDTNVIIGAPPSQIKLTYDQRFCDSPSITQTRASDGTTTLQSLTANRGDVILSPAPTETTTYTLAGTHAGNTVTKTVTVYVNQAPVITNFTVADNTLAPNFGSTFTIGSIGGTSWSIDNGVGSATLTTTAGINSGTKTFTIPPGTAAGVYTYTLTATNSISSTTATLTITVAPAPLIAAFTATAGVTGSEPGTIYTMHYDVTEADTASISPRLGILIPSAVRTFLGDACDYPGSTTTYTLTATNIYGTSTATATATINTLLGLDANGWTVTMYKAATAGTMTNLANTDALIAGTAARGTVLVGGVTTATPITKANIPRINFANNAASGVFGGDTWPTEFGPTNTTDMAAVATATIVVNYEDDYTISINNDDGARLQIDLNNDGDFLDPGEEVIVDDAGHGPITTSNDRHLTTGPHAIQYTWFQGTGGYAMEVFFTTAQGTNVLFEPVAAAPALVTSGLIISEFQASNSGTLKDYDGQNSDWIELFNGTAAAINLSGFAITDDAALPAKYKFAASGAPTIQAGQYLVVFASGKNVVYPTGEIHANFKLASDFTLPATTGYVALTKDDGTATNTYVTVSSYTYPEQKKDRSYGVSGAGLHVGVIAVPTPGGRNFASYLGFVGDTSFDHDRGNNYTAAFDLAITTSDPAAQIRYTTDGSEPSVYKGIIYTAPLHIDKTSVIRAAGFRKDYAPTNIDTQTYIFVPDVVTQNRAQAIAQGWPNEPNGTASATLNNQVFDYGMDPLITTGNEAAIQAALKAIPSLSLVVDPASLFDKTSGIFVNALQRGKAWERVASLELINDVYADPTLATKDPLVGGNGQFQVASGVRIRGGASRSTGNPKREWHLYFRSELDGSLTYPLFGTDGGSKFDQLDIKTSNNYSWSFAPTNPQLTYTPVGGASTVKRINMNTMMRDVFSRDTQRDMGQPHGRGRYYHLYVNAVYWGLHEIEERTEASFGETYLGGDKNNYDVVKSAGNANAYNTEATDGSMLQGTSANPGSAWARLWWRARELRLTAGLTDTQRDERLLDLMGLKPDGTAWNDAVNHPVLLDVDNLADYLLTSFYCGSYDAPMSTFVTGGSNNWFGMRDRNGTEGFKFFAHDFEHGFGTDWNSGATAPNINRGATPGVVAVPVGIQIGTTVTGNTGTPVTYAATGWQLHSTDARSFDRTGPWGAGDGVLGGSVSAADTNTKQERNWKGQLMYELSVTYLKSNPHLIHEDLCFSREYRRQFADRAYKHLGRTGGALTQTEVNKRLDTRAATVGGVIIGESARWGDAKGQALADYQVSSWTNAKNFLYDWVARGSNQAYTAWLTNPATTGIGRSAEIIKQLQNYRDKANASGVTFDASTPPNPNDAGLLSLPLYPLIGTPTFDLVAGIYPVNTTLTISNNNTTGATTYTIYYTTNGMDPRAILTGLPAASAINAGTGATATVSLTATGPVLARVFDGTTWSALFDTSYIIGAPATHDNFVITEINYNPPGSVSPGGAVNPGTALDPQLYEFIELRNISAATLQLTGVKFSLAIDFTFPDGSTLAPGARLVVARDPGSFSSRYPLVSVGQIFGPWLGALNNGGERLTLTDASLAVIQSVYYNNTPAGEIWPSQPRGDGPSLVFLTPNAPAASAANSPPAEWTSHTVNLGNPGGPDFGYTAFFMANGATTNGQGDNDKDGISDLIEYILGGNPTNPDGAASSTDKLPTSALMNLVVGANPAEPYQTLTYTRAPNTTDVTVAAQTSSDLGNADAWTADAVLVSTTVNGDNSTTYIYRCPLPYSTTNREFMRLLVTLPAS
jgi:hypothetical protein